MKFTLKFFVCSICLFALDGTLAADPAIRLKRRAFHAPADLEAHRAGPLLRRNPGRSHFLIQFPSPPTPAQIAELKHRGSTIVNYVPDSALVVSSGDDSSWYGLGLRYAGRVDELDKLSPSLSPDLTPDGNGGNFALVEFYPDVAMDDARALILDQNLTIDDRGNMLPYQLLVNGPLDWIERLAQWDEVAYIYPASTELATGGAVWPCAGPITELGPVAQYVLASPGWPQTGAAGSPIALNYVFGQLTTQIPAATVQSEILRALNVWTTVANVTFSPGQNATDPRTLSIFFASGAHGDDYPFVPDSGVLAHTFYPAPPNSEPIAGDMHLNADESWSVGSGVDVFSVALHEAGHALGMAHTDNPNAVMYPYYRFNTGLSADDIAGVQSIYGAPQSSPGGTTTALSTPAPAPPIPAAAPLTISIASPATNSTTAATTISASGSAAGGSGALRVTWADDAGGSGTASGAASWTVPTIALAAGVNHIMLTVTDATGKTASQTVIVTLNAPATTLQAPQPPTAPTPPSGAAPPALAILSPGSQMVLTSASTIDLTGISSDPYGVAKVGWANTFGSSGTATGTTNWQIAHVPLLVGTNKITVSAYDSGGNFAWRLITVVRQ